MFLLSSPHFNSKERIHSFGYLFSFDCLKTTVNLQFRTFGGFKFRFRVSEKNNVPIFTFQTSGPVMKTRLEKKSLAMECFNN